MMEGSASRTTGEGPRVLLVEDDPSHALLMRERLEDLVEEIDHADTRGAAMNALRRSFYDLVVLDAGLPDGSGFELQQRALERPGAPSVVFVTSDDRAEHAVAALRSGAAHYVVKRANYLEQMAEAVREALAMRPRRLPTQRQAGATPDPSEVLVGESPGIEDVRARIRGYGPAEAPVLVLGETGTGKELVAQALHRASARSKAPFVPVNCAAIAAGLFESEVFGSVRGAYTGAVTDRPGLVGGAEGGTLFLDEVSELPLEAQAKLLRLLESGAYRPVGAARELRADVRVIAAANRDLREAVRAGQLRSDLFYRLNVLRIHLPPLRERKEDVPALVDHFLRRFAGQGPPARPTPEALASLLAYPWPGNVRELEHVVQRTLLHRGPGPLHGFDLGREGDAPEPCPDPSAETLAALLEHWRGRLGPVARELGVSVRTVQRRIKRLGIRREEFL